MRKITVTRPQKIQFPFTKGKILINGTECAVIKAGKTVEFEIPDDARDIQVTFAVAPPVQSNVLQIDPADGDAAFEVKIKVPLKNTDPTYAELTKK